MTQRELTNLSLPLSSARSWFRHGSLGLIMLAAVAAGCGEGLQLGTTEGAEEEDPPGPATLHEACDAADDGTYILGFRRSVLAEPEALQAALADITRAGGSVKRDFFPQMAMVAASLPPSALTQLRDNPALTYISKNCRHSLQASDLARVPANLDRIDQRSAALDYVYQMPGTGAGVDVYVVDSGIYTQHPQFGGRAFKLYKATGITDPRGADDCSGHGTIVAGVIGGIDYGVAKEASLHSIRVADCDGITNDMWIAEGIQQAILHHQATPQRPGVLNLSLAQEKTSKAASEAVKAAWNAGLIVVGAAGNFGKSACDHFPAAYPDMLMMGLPKRDPNVIVAGVVNAQDQAVRSAVVNSELIQFDYGDCIDLYAPGVDIVSAGAPSPTTGPNGETRSSGTSLAAAHVTGVVALFLERFPRSTPTQIKQAVKQAATGGVVTGTTSSAALLVFNGNSSLFPPRAIQLAMPVPVQPVTQRGEVWHQTSFVVNRIPASSTVTLSTDLAGTVGTAVDDVFRLNCVDVNDMGQPFGSTRSSSLKYNAGRCDHIRTLPPQNLSSLLARNQQGRCQLSLYDSCGVVRGGTRLFLNVR